MNKEAITVGVFIGRADEAVQRFGKQLLGRKILTLSLGAYPGGVARAIGLRPDKNAPDIVLQVRHDDPTVGEIGILEWEQIGIA